MMLKNLDGTEFTIKEKFVVSYIWAYDRMEGLIGIGKRRGALGR